MPVMVIQNAGRDSFEHHERFITNSLAFIEMCNHIKTYIKKPVKTVTTVDANFDVFGLTEFHGHSL